MPRIAENDEYGFPEMDAPDGFERKPSRLPLVLLGLAVFAALFAVGYTMFTHSVVYYHTPTEVLKMTGEAVVEGAMGADGVFHADQLFAKCPSKFQAKTTESQ
jgi:cytochrome c-type biogenesis protein CcmE